MKLIITESAASGGNPDFDWTVRHLSLADSSFLDKIDEVFLHYQTWGDPPRPGIFPDLSPEKRNEVREMLSSGKLHMTAGTSNDAENPIDKAKIKAIIRLLDNLTLITDKELVDPAFRKSLEDAETCFFYPLYDKRIRKFIKSIPNIKGYIYLNGNETSRRVGFAEIEDPALFFLADEQLEYIKEENRKAGNQFNYSDLIPLSHLIDYGVIRHPGYYFSGGINNKFSSESVLFIGNYENIVKYSIEYFLSEKRSVYHHDCAKGLPNDLNSDFEAAALINVDKLSIQNRKVLFSMLKTFGYLYRRTVALHADCAAPLPELAVLFVKVEIPGPDKIRKDITALFFSVLNRRNFFWGNLMLVPEIFENNALKILLKGIDDAGMLQPVAASAGYFEPEVFWGIGFWYNICLEIKKLAEARKKPASHENSSETAGLKEYKWICRGDYWEISFGYKEPVLIEKLLGMYFIAHLMNSPGRQWDALQLYNHVVKNNSKKEYDIDSLRKTIRDSINAIKRCELELDLGDSLSQYLMSAFLPYSPELKAERRKTGESAFKRDNICEFNSPDPEIKWTINTPFYITLAAKKHARTSSSPKPTIKNPKNKK